MARLTNNIIDFNKINIENSDSSIEAKPVLIVPQFDIDNPMLTIKKAIITITEGFQPGDKLELDANYTLVKNDDHYNIENTNISIFNGMFNEKLHQLILQGEDSVSNYNDVFESILLENPDGLNGTYHRISFTLVDTDGKIHRLGSTEISLPQIINGEYSSFEDNFDQDFNFDDAMNDPVIESEINRVNLDSTDIFSNYYSEYEYHFGLGHGNDVIEAISHDKHPSTINLEGIAQGPSNELSGDGSWIFGLEENIDYVINGNKLIFCDKASGSLTLSDGSDLYFENIDMIVWSNQ